MQGASLEYAYEILSSLSTSTQGLAVSVLCFSNHEVVAKLRQSARNIALYSPKVTTQCQLELSTNLRSGRRRPQAPTRTFSVLKSQIS